MTDTLTQLIPVACFALGALLGAWLTHRRDTGLSPVPRWSANPAKMFNWVRHGTETPKEGDEPPPIEYEGDTEHPGGRL